MINNDIDIKNMNKLNILKKCILVRDVVDFEKILLYKYKDYDSNGDILKQGKVKCPIDDISKAKEFMEAINYRELFKINDKCIVYRKNNDELVVQIVDVMLFIKIESKDLNKDLISIINSYNLPIDKSNYYIKKALIKLEGVI